MTINKTVYPVNFSVDRNVARFRGANNKLLFTIKSSDEFATKYHASAVCKALNAHFGLLNSTVDLLKIVSSDGILSQLTMEEHRKIGEIGERVERLTAKRERNAFNS